MTKPKPQFMIGNSSNNNLAQTHLARAKRRLRRRRNKTNAQDRRHEL